MSEVLWDKCLNCDESIFKQTLRRNLHVCPNCNYYGRMPIDVRFDQLLDEGANIRFSGEMSKEEQSVVSSEGKISGHDVILAVIDSDLFTLSPLHSAVEQAIDRQIPLISVYENRSSEAKKSKGELIGLAMKMELHQRNNLQISVITGMRQNDELLPIFPFGTLTIAEAPFDRASSESSVAFIDSYVERSELSEHLGKLLAWTT